jgi:hypothetical protein
LSAANDPNSFVSDSILRYGDFLAFVDGWASLIDQIFMPARYLSELQRATRNGRRR